MDSLYKFVVGIFWERNKTKQDRWTQRPFIILTSPGELLASSELMHLPREPAGT